MIFGSYIYRLGDSKSILFNILDIKPKNETISVVRGTKNKATGKLKYPLSGFS